MKKRILYYLGIVFLLPLSSKSTNAQVKLLLLDGEQISTNWLKYEKSDSLFYYKSKKGKLRYVESEFIFSIQEPNSSEKILYRPDSVLNFNPQEMRALIAGQIQAKQKYSPYFSIILGAGIGLAGTLIPYTAGISLFYSSLIPLGISQSAFLLPISSKKIELENQLQYPEIYKKGFILKARKKRFVYNIMGILVGMGVSYSLYNSQFK